MYTQTQFLDFNKEGDWVCTCNNTRYDEGFTTVDKDGDEVTVAKEWHTDYLKCNNCNLVFEQFCGEIVR